MPKFAEQLGMAAAPGVIGQIVGTGIGMATAKWNDKRQLKQQGKLNEQEYEISNRMAEENYKRQMRMWEETSYEAQKAQMKKAGLNPALMYGMSGGGGQTVGSQGASLGGGKAPAGGGELSAAQGMGLQMGMMAAQIKVMESQANLNNVEAKKKEGVDTALGNTQIASLKQGIESAKSQQALTEIETILRGIQVEKDSRTVENQIEQIADLARIVKNDREVSDATKDSKMEIIWNEAIGVTLRNALTVQQTNESIKKQELTDAQITQIAVSIAQKWRELDQNDTRLGIEQFKAEVGELGVLGGIATNTIGSLFNLFKKGTKISKTNINITRPVTGQ